MRADLLIKGGTIVTPEAMFRGSVAIVDGKIAGLLRESEATPTKRTIDAEGLHVFPGFVDAHVHFRDPGFTHKGDFGSESAAAAFGGITTVIDGPNTGTVVRYPHDIEEKRAIAEKASVVDFGQLAAITPDNVEYLQSLAEAGVVGLKLFLGFKRGDSVLDLTPPDGELLLAALLQVRQTGLRLSVHAEEQAVLTHERSVLQARGDDRFSAYEWARPAYGEAIAIDGIVRRCEAIGQRLEIRHLSSADGLQVLHAAKLRGVDVVVETCPHYLAFSDSELLGLGPLAIVNPPIRSGRHRDTLLRGINDGVIDTIGTDHAPQPLEEKLQESVWKVAPGFSGVETAFAFLNSLVTDGRLSLGQIAKLYSESPAKAWDLYPTKGSLYPGADADLAVCDLEASWTVDEARLHSKCPTSPFSGRTLTGRVVHTILRGALVIESGELVADRRGSMVKPWFPGRYSFAQCHGPVESRRYQADSK
jgi:dihydroorotase